MRLSRVLLAAATVLAVLPASAAHAASAGPASVATGPCSASTLKIPFITTSPVARRAGQAVTQLVPMRNTANVTVTRVFFDFELPSPSPHRSRTPSMWWRRGTTGAWRVLPLPYWTPAQHGALAFWETNDTAFGRIAAHAHALLELRVSFHPLDPSGDYGGGAAFGARECSDPLVMIGFVAVSFDFRTAGV
jgi:hypothetical protein